MSSAQSDLLLGLSTQEAEALMAKGTGISLGSGRVLFDLGAPADSVYFLTRGRLRLTLPIEVRGEDRDVLIEERTVGETVGWSGLPQPPSIASPVPRGLPTSSCRPTPACG